MNIKILGRVIFISKPVLIISAVLITAIFMIAGNLSLNNKTEDSLLISSESGNGKAFYTDGKSTPIAAYNVNPSNTSVIAEKIYIYIVGAVKDPGLYKIDKDSLVFDAVALAGGLSQEADMSYINMAQKLNQNLMLRILTEKERKEQKRDSALLIITDNNAGNTGSDENPDSNQGQASSVKININTASKSELMSLSGIGEKKAQDIIDFRESNGKFKKIEDIMLVAGIKEATFNSIKDMITV